MESTNNLSGCSDNNNISTFLYGNNSFIKSEITPFSGQRYTDQGEINILQSSSNKIK